MEYMSAVPFGGATAFYRICQTYSNAFLATLERYTGQVTYETPPVSVFFIKQESGCLGDAVHKELIEQLAACIDMQDQHLSELRQL